jgi:hypothetical protein
MHNPPLLTRSLYDFKVAKENRGGLMRKIDTWDAFISLLLSVMSGVGVFYTTIRFEATAMNVYGDQVTLFGRGIYAYESLFQGPIFIGTDIVVLMMIIVFLVLMNTMKNEPGKNGLRIGFYTVFLYYSASLCLGTMMNPLFMVYVTAFGVLFYRLISELVKFDYSPSGHAVKEKRMPKGLSVFLVVLGLSTSVWFLEIITLVVEGRPSHLIGMKSTEPTYVFDLAIIAPACFLAAHMLRKQKAIGVILAIMMCLLMASIGLIVTSQTVTQRVFGVEISLFEMLVFVVLTF